MTRTLAVALATVLCLGTPAVAQDARAPSECAEGAKPVVSEGLPKRPCASRTGVVVNRGPAVVPEPSAITPDRPVATEGTGGTTIRRVIRRRDPFGYQASYIYPRRPVASYRREGGASLTIRSGDVLLRIGDGYRRPAQPHRRHRGDRGSKHQPSYGNNDKPLIGVHRRFD